MRQRAGDRDVGLIWRVAATIVAAAVTLFLLAGPAFAEETFPTTSIYGIPAGWSPVPVTFTLEVEAYQVPGTIFTWYGFDNDPLEAYTGPVTVSREGATSVTFYSRTSACNSNEGVHHVDIFIDRTPPVTSIAGLPSGWQTSGGVFGFTLSGSDAGSGVAQTYYRVDGGAPVPYAGGVVPVIAVQTTWIQYWSQDAAGNVENARTAVIKVAGGQPVTTVSGLPAGLASSNVTFTLTAESHDAAVSGTWYRLGGGSVTPYASPVAVTGEGTTLVEFGSVDGNGVRETTRAVQVSIDKTPPTSTVAGVHSGWYATVAHLVFAASDDRTGVAEMRYREGTGAWTSHAAPASIEVTTQGSSSFQWYAVDVAGNAEAIHTSAVSIDRSPPATSISGLPAGVSAGPVTFTLAATDPYSGVAATYYSLDGVALPYTGPVTVSKVGTTTLSFWSVDALGNTEPQLWSYVQISSGSPGPAPVTSAQVAPPTPDGDNGWYRSVPTITVLRDIAGTTYFKAAGDVSYTTSPLAAFSRSLARGDVTYIYYGVSATDVTEAPAHSVRIKVDTIAPYTSSDAAPSYAGAAAVHLSAGDDSGGSGVAHTYYRLDSGAQAEGATVVVSALGAHALEFWSIDVAGNAETPHRTAAFAITVPPPTDTTAPRTTSDAATAYVGSATIHLNASDEAGGSGVAHTYYHLDSGAQAEGATVVVSALGTHTLEFWSIDVAGNVEIPHNTAAFAITAPPPSDTTAPHTTSDAATAYVGSATIHLSASDEAGGSGVAHTHYRLDSGAQAEGTTVAVSTLGVHTLEFWSIDVAGNVEIPHHTAAFAIGPITHTVTASAGFGGSISPSGALVVVEGGSSPTFTITPNAGYHVADVLVDANSVGAVSVYRFDHVEASHTIVATFAQNAKVATSITLATSATSARIGRTFVLSGRISPSPELIGALMHVDVKKPTRAYWTYSSARVVYADAGQASWWYRYYLKPGMVRGIYRFKAVYDSNAAYRGCESPPVAITVR